MASYKPVGITVKEDTQAFETDASIKSLAVRSEAEMSILNALEQGIIILDDLGRVVAWNTWFSERSGIALEQARTLTLERAFPVLEAGRIIKEVARALERQRPATLSHKLLDQPFPLWHKGREPLPENLLDQAITIKPLATGDGLLVLINDISKSIQREQTLRDQAHSLKHALSEVKNQSVYINAIFENSKDAIVIFASNGIIESVNPAFMRIFSVEGTAEERGIAEFIPELDEHSTEQSRGYYLTNATNYELTGLCGNGQTLPLDYVADAMDVPQGQKFFALIRDISEQKKTQDALIQLARYDSLTSLANRSAFHDRLDETIARAQRRQSYFALMFLDLDHFKTINDSLGHDVGDGLLKEVAGRLKSNLRGTDIVARLGGDEFTVILEYLSADRDASLVADKILKAMAEPANICGNEFFISTSIGIAMYPRDGADQKTLTKHADMAMYKAKNDGRNTYRFFDPEMNKGFLERLQITTELRTAVEERQFVLHYQMLVDLNSGQVVGAESLIRWRHPERGIVSPNDFISIAEESGQIVDIGNWIIEQACRDAAAWSQGHVGRLKVAINLSPRQFRDRLLIKILRAALEKNKMPPACLTVEITESHLVQDSELGVEIVHKLKALGVQIAIDDFGTGYSSLSYLKCLPVDIVKIDRSFVDGAESDPNARTMISGIIELIHGLGMKVVAEGIENDAQLQLLRSEGCDIGQGFYLAHPMEQRAIEEWLLNNDEIKQAEVPQKRSI